MKGTAKTKVVTSGRLTGKVGRRVTSNPGPAGFLEPSYSLYSTDSEDQVTTLHKGLDRCAALLGCILQDEKTEALPSPPRAVKGAAAKSRPSLGKKSIKKPSTRTDLKSSKSARPGCTTPKTRHQPPVSAAHSGVKLHPRQKHPHPPPPQCKTPPQPALPPADLSPQTDPLAPPQPALEGPRECGVGEEDLIPVRDSDTQSVAAAADLRVSNMEPCVQLEQDCGAEVKAKTTRYLLGELKTLIAGEGSVAERLLSHLEQTLSSTLMNVGGANVQTEVDISSLRSQNNQLRRRVRTLQEQLKERERAERQPNTELLCNSEAFALQEELSAAQLRLQEVQGDLTELQAQNALVTSDLEVTRSRLLVSEREKSELASLAQQRLEDIERLHRALQSRTSPDCPPVADSPVLTKLQHRPDPAERPADRITQYLMSLDQLEQNQPAEISAPQCQSLERRGRPLDPAACNESVLSDWSVRSGSTFNTRDEAAFRDGLSALDASIASLQRTLQLDLGR